VHPNLIGLHGSLAPPEPKTINGISIGSAVFAGLDCDRDRPTDRKTLIGYSVCKL